MAGEIAHTFNPSTQVQISVSLRPAYLHSELDVSQGYIVKACHTKKKLWNVKLGIDLCLQRHLSY